MGMQYLIPAGRSITSVRAWCVKTENQNRFIRSRFEITDEVVYGAGFPLALSGRGAG